MTETFVTGSLKSIRPRFPAMQFVGEWLLLEPAMSTAEIVTLLPWDQWLGFT